MKTVLPNDGGCWYCHRADDNLVFCTEFDTNIHVKCARKANKDDANDSEANYIYSEVKEAHIHEVKKADTKKYNVAAPGFYYSYCLKGAYILTGPFESKQICFNRFNKAIEVIP